MEATQYDKKNNREERKVSGGGGAEYELAGTTPSAKTSKYIENAINHFNKFLQTKDIGKFIELSEVELTQRSIYQEFGTYLVRRATSVIGAEQITEKHALNLLSYVIVKAKERFPHAQIWHKDTVNDWYTALRKDISTKIKRKQYLLGDLLKSKSPGIGRDLLKRLNHELMIIGTAHAESLRAKLNMSFSAIGRSGEVALASWAKSTWY